MKRLWILLAAPWLLLVGPSAESQEGVLDLFGRLWAVSDSSEVRDLLDRASDAAGAGDWDTAAARLQSILDYYPDHVVRVGDQHYEGARDRVLGILRGWPDEGREAYRILVDPRARKRLERGLAEKKVGDLNGVWRKFPLSTHAGTALNAAGLLHLTAGRTREAADAFRSLLEGEVPHVISRTDLRARLAFTLARMGEADELRTLVEAQTRDGRDATVVLGGKTHEALAVLGRYLEEAVAAETDPQGWPQYGGFPARNVRQGPTAVPGPLQWSTGSPIEAGQDIEVTHRDLDFQHGDYVRGPQGWPLHLRRWYPVHPVLGHGRLIVQNGRTVLSLDPFTGEPSWDYSVAFAGDRGRTNFGTVYSAAVTPDAVYANLEVPRKIVSSARASHYQNMPIIYPIPERRLFALDARTGVVLWSHEDADVAEWPEGEFLRTASVDTPPLVVGDLLYVPMTRFEGRYHAFLCAIDRRTGRLRWKTRLCIGQMELNLFGRPVKEASPSAVSTDGRSLYVCTNLGVVASVDPRTRLVRWIRGYPQIDIPFSRLWYRVEERAPTWTNAAPIVKDGVLLVTPTDSSFLLALDTDDGRTRWRFDRGDPSPRRRSAPGDVMTEMLGADDHHVYVAGSAVYAIDLRSGKLRWEGRLEGGEESAGRGAVTEDTVYCPTTEALYAYDAETGVVRWRKDWLEMDGPAFPGHAGGNLLVRDGLLLVAGRKAVEGYYDWSGVFRKLEEQIRATPHDVALRLRAGRIYLRGGRLGAAENCFEEVRRQTTRATDEAAIHRRAEASRGLHGVRMARVRASLEMGNLERVESLLRTALREAPDAASRIQTRLTLIQLADRREDAAAAVHELRAMAEEDGAIEAPFPDLGVRLVGPEALFRAADRNLARNRPREAVADLQAVIERHPDAPWEEGDAGVVAQRLIGRLIKLHDRAVYEIQDRAAARALASARLGGTESDLLAVVQRWPNSLAAPRALVTTAERRMALKDWPRAVDVLRRRLQFEDERPEQARALALLLLCQERRGRYASAHSLARKLLDRYADVEIRLEGRPVLGRDLANERLDTEPYRRVAASAGLPELELPLAERWSVDEGEDSLTRLLQIDGVPPTGAEGRVFVLSDALVLCRDAATGRILWRHPAPNARETASFCDDNLVLYAQDGAVAIDTATGQVRWTHAPALPLRGFRASQDSVYLLYGSFRERKARTLVALGARSGDVLWQRDLDGSFLDEVLVTPDVVVAVSNNPPSIQVHDAMTGRLSFEIPLEEGVYRQPFLVEGARLLVVHGNRALELWDLGKRKKAWTYTLPPGKYFRSALSLGAQVLLTDMGDTLRVLDGTTGKQVWSASVQKGRNLAYQGEAADDSNVYVIHRDPEGLYMASAMSRTDGSVVWQKHLIDSKSAHILPQVTRGHVIYHANSYDLEQNAWSSKTIVLDRNTGDLVQKIEVESIQGAYSHLVLDRGLMGLFSRGRLSLHGPK